MRSSNHLLQGLEARDYDALARDMEAVSFRSGEVLYEPGDQVDWIYFPERGLISLLSVMPSGAAVETSEVGNEGGVGFLEVGGAGVTFSRAMVQVDLLALRVPARDYNAALDASPSLRQRVTSHVELLMAEARQMIACQSQHAHGQRLARRLLEFQDRTGGGSHLALKQHSLAAMLGIQRSTVSQLASALKAAGIIDYTRGEIEILDRERLELRSCECYVATRRYRRLIETHPTRTADLRSDPVALDVA